MRVPSARSRYVVGLSALVAGAVLAGVTPASATLGAGDMAPMFTGKDFVNTPEISLKTLRGRLVLCEVFSTT